MPMSRTVEETLAHADELAERFENYEPSPDDELDPAVVGLLRAAVAERSAAEKHLVEARPGSSGRRCVLVSHRQFRRYDR